MKEVENMKNELGAELKKYHKKLEIKALQSFFETMFRRGIDLFKVDRVIITCTSRQYEENVKIEAIKIDAFKEELLMKEEKFFLWEEVEFIESLHNYRGVIEKGLGSKIDFKEEKTEDFEMLYTWEIDCTGIK
jgi:hypothetical protein